jgi:hypothetical protein
VSNPQSKVSSQGKTTTQPGDTTPFDFNFSNDPDAAYRPFVTPYFSTRPPADCGKVEDVEG